MLLTELYGQCVLDGADRAARNILQEKMRTAGHRRTWGNTLNACLYMASTEAGEILYQQVTSLNQEPLFLKGPECQKSSHKDAALITQLLKFLSKELNCCRSIRVRVVIFYLASTEVSTPLT